MHPGSTREHARSQFVRSRSIAGVVSRSNLDWFLATGRWKSYRRRTESGDHLVMEQHCERFKVLSIGCVIPQQ